MEPFFQVAPEVGHPFRTDETLQSVLRRHLDESARASVFADLDRFGTRVIEEVAPLGEDAEKNEPRLVSFDPWGRRIDFIETSRGWRELDRISAEEGLVAIGYERAIGEWSRLHQFAKLYLFSPASAIYSCPLAMTDGAARLLEQIGPASLQERALSHLLSRDPAQFWTSGQWMTERTGGSDVGGTSTLATPIQGEEYHLTGDKWFTSATTSQMALTLARIVDPSGATTPGSRGLSLFYLETRRPDGSLNGIRIHRLKDKLGTRALPTAELSLEGTLATRIGPPGAGVRSIACMINVTRIYNALCSIASMRRMLVLLRDYAQKRLAFGKKLANHPLHLELMADLSASLEGSTLLVFHLVNLLGKEDVGQATAAERAVLRLMTPIAKLFTAKQAVAFASETLEAFGGAGYVENTGLPRLLRDAQVLPIWEGTTNVLSLDVLRAMVKEEAFGPWMEHIQELVSPAEGELAEHAAAVRAALGDIAKFASEAAGESPEFFEANARRFAMALARSSIAALLVDHAHWRLEVENDLWGVLAAARWLREPLAVLPDVAEWSASASRQLALGTATTSACSTEPELVLH